MTRVWVGGMAAFGAGALFGGGLIVGGMTRPQKIIGFLDVFGAWDPSLIFVMIGAISVHFFAYRLVRGWSRPLSAEGFSIPRRRPVDGKLLVGAAVFGVGWGLGGYCPGPSIVSLASGFASVSVFVGALLLGMFATMQWERLARRDSPAKVDDAA